MKEEGIEINPDGDEVSPSPSGAVGFRFAPTEDELILRHLLSRLRGFGPHFPGADVVIGVEDDPSAAAPRGLVDWHGSGTDRAREEAFFFARRSRRRNGYAHRAVAGGAGGTWKHSWTNGGESVTELGVVVPWRRECYIFYERGEDGQLRSTEWVLAEYEITDPSTYRRAAEEEDEYWVLCQVRRRTRNAAWSPTGRKRKRKADVGDGLSAAVAQSSACEATRHGRL